MTRHDDEQTRPASATRPSFPRASRAWIAGGAVAAALVGSAWYNRAQARRAETDFPPAGRFVEVDGVRLHYVDQGQGETVVLLHGNGFMLQDFEASGVMAQAALRYRVLAFDRPGFGYSDRPRGTVWIPAAQARLIAGALRTLGIGRALVVGHSWGTLVALAMALDEPDAVSGLLLLSGYYYGTARPDVWLLSPPAVPLVGDVMANTLSPLAGRLSGPAAIKASFWPAPISPKIEGLPFPLMLRPSQVRATAADTALMVPAAVALSRRYGELVLPVTIMAGAGDLIASPARHAERLAGEIDGADLKLVPGQGHLFHYAVPEQVVAAMGEVSARVRS